MKILSEKDRKDGGLDLEIEFTEEEINMLIEKAVITILKEYIAELEKPEIIPRRPLMGSWADYEETPVMMESDKDFVLNNIEACVEFLERQ